MKHDLYLDHPIFREVGAAAKELGTDVYVIGGYVRDRLLDRGRPKDIDFVCTGNGIELAEAVAARVSNHPRVTVFKTYGTAMFKTEDLELEFVGARKESYSNHTRNPEVESGSLTDDQNRRDFTINALAIGLNEKDWGVLIDPFDGLNDLKKGIIRTPLDPDITFSDDPLRMLRAVRFASQLRFGIWPASLRAIKKNAERLEIITRERISDEFNKILASPQPGVGLKLLYETGLLHQFLPELVALQGVEEVEGQVHKDNFYHTLEVVDNLSRNSDNLWLRYAALLHDIGKPVVKRFDPKTGWTFHGHEAMGGRMIPGIFKKLRLPQNEKMKYVQRMVRLSSRPIAITQDDTTDSAVRRLLFEAGEEIEDLMLLCESDITTKNARRKARYLENFRRVRIKLKEVEERDRLRNWQPPIDGQEIMDAFDLKPGPEIGEIKNAIREAILEGEIPNEYPAARKLMLELGKKMGLKPTQAS